MIDQEEKDFPFHKENCIFIKPFSDPSEKDEELKMLIPFLASMAMAPARDVPDFRRVLTMYGNRDVGAQYTKRLNALKAKEKARKSRSIFGRRSLAGSSASAKRTIQQQQQQQTANMTTSNTSPAANSSPKEASKPDDGAPAIPDAAAEQSKKGGLWSWLGVSSKK